MSSRDEALVTPSVMRWARQRAGLDVPTAAHALKRSEDDVVAWEDGSKRPSLAQARDACRIYRRSLAVLFLPEPPIDFDALRDYRLLPTSARHTYSPDLALLLRQVLARQEWAREFLEEEGQAELAFVGSASTADDVVRLAMTIRNGLGVTLEEQRHCRDHRQALNLWVQCAETLGVHVCRQGIVEPEEARGFALADMRAPFVFVNSSDALAGQIFTLLHEIVHLWTNLPGISNLVGLEYGQDTPDLAVERFCNRVAAEMLIDRDDFNNHWGQTRGALPDRIEMMARRYWASEEVVARRLLDQRRISAEQYKDLRDGYRVRWEAYRGTKPAGGNPYRNAVARNGRRFTSTVLGAYRSGRVTAREASSLLHMKVNHFPRLAEAAHQGVRR